MDGTADALRWAATRHAEAHAGPDGLAPTLIPGLNTFRATAPTSLVRAVYRPLLCLVLSGAKEVTAGGATHAFVAGRSVLVTADLPVLGRVVRASPAVPYLAVALDLDMGVVREVAARLPPPPDADPVPATPVRDGGTDAAVADCVLRLLRLLDRPEAIPVLRPGIVTEFHYWLLAGRHGAAIRRLAAPDGHAARVARAVAILRAEFATPIPVSRLADAAGMSPSAFHAHFRAATSLSPLRFQKHLRLLEARRLLRDEGEPATRAAFAVGYASVPQFTRDYARMFGAPPRRDAMEARAA